MPLSFLIDHRSGISKQNGKNILNEKPHYKNLRDSWQYYSSWFKKIDISHQNQRIWGGFIFFLAFHSYHIVLPQWKLEFKNVSRTFFNGLLWLNKMSKRSKILEIYSLQMNKYLLHTQWKVKRKYKPLFHLT